MQKFVSVPKLFGTWTNHGDCIGNNEPMCGPGIQPQTRSCTDGTADKCTEEDKWRDVDCNIAGTQLLDCLEYGLSIRNR